MTSLASTALPAAARPDETATQRRWPLWGAAAGILGAIGTLFANVSSSHKEIDASVVKGLSSTNYHLGGAAGYIAIACLLVLAASWRTATARVAPGSIAARVVADGFTASAAALTLGYGWKLAMAVYLPGGINSRQFGSQGIFTYYVLNDFGAFIGWLGVVIAAGAFVWLGLRDKLLPTWLAVISLLPPLAVLVMACGFSVAGYQGIVAPIWLIVASAALGFGRTRFTDTQ